LERAYCQEDREGEPSRDEPFEGVDEDHLLAVCYILTFRRTKETKFGDKAILSLPERESIVVKLEWKYEHEKKMYDAFQDEFTRKYQEFATAEFNEEERHIGFERIVFNFKERPRGHLADAPGCQLHKARGRKRNGEFETSSCVGSGSKTACNG
jgi:hypothetical protein